MWLALVPVMKISMGSRKLLWTIVMGLFTIVTDKPGEFQRLRII